MSRRVLFIIGSGSVGGREGQLLQLARHLAEAGWQPGVAFISCGGPIADQLGAAGIPVWVPPETRRDALERKGEQYGSSRLDSIRTRIFLASRLIAAVRVLRWARRQHRPDVVHAMLPTSIWFGLPVGTRRASRRIAGVYGFTPEMSPLVHRLYRREVRRAHAVVANAPHLLTGIAQKFDVPAERLRLIPNAVNLPTFVADPLSEPPRAVTLANFHSYKGHADLLHALTMLPAALSLTVRLCGTGDQRAAMQQLAAELGVSDRVEFVDPPADVPAELAGAQFAIHPSRTEGLSNAILEELAAGLPVVACTVGGNPLLITDKVDGLLVPPADPLELAAAISALAEDPALRVRMGQAARTRAERFGWSVCVQAHIDLYNSVLAGASR